MRGIPGAYHACCDFLLFRARFAGIRRTGVWTPDPGPLPARRLSGGREVDQDQRLGAVGRVYRELAAGGFDDRLGEDVLEDVRGGAHVGEAARVPGAEFSAAPRRSGSW